MVSHRIYYVKHYGKISQCTAIVCQRNLRHSTQIRVMSEVRCISDRGFVFFTQGGKNNSIGHDSTHTQGLYPD